MWKLRGARLSSTEWSVMSGDLESGVKLRAKKSASNSAVRRCIYYNVCLCICHSTCLFRSYFIVNSTRARTVFSFLYLACLLNNKRMSMSDIPTPVFSNHTLTCLLMLSTSGTVARMPHDSKVRCHTTCLNKETFKLLVFKFLNYKVQFYILVTHVLVFINN